MFAFFMLRLPLRSQTLPSLSSAKEDKDLTDVQCTDGNSAAEQYNCEDGGTVRKYSIVPLF